MLDMVIGVLALVAGDPVAAVSPPSVVVSGACTCPAPADVEAQLAALARPSTSRPSAPTPPERHHAVLTCAADGTVDVVLRHANGERIADRALVAEGSCSDLASALAVIIGAWEADLDPGVSTSVALLAPVVVDLPRPQPQQAAPPPPSAPAAPETALPVAATTARSEPPAGAPLSPSPEEVAAVEHPGPRPPAVRVRSVPDVSGAVGLLGAMTGGTIVPGATLEGDVFRAGSHLGLAAALTATLPREASVGPLSNVAHWYRLTASLGPAFRFAAGSTRVDLQAGVVAALLHVAGTGIPNSSSDTGLQRGAVVAVRATRPWGPTAIWAGLGLLVFPGDDRLVVSNVATDGHLPHVELQLASGVSFGRPR